MFFLSGYFVNQIAQTTHISIKLDDRNAVPFPADDSTDTECIRARLLHSIFFVWIHSVCSMTRRSTDSVHLKLENCKNMVHSLPSYIQMMATAVDVAW